MSTMMFMVSIGHVLSRNIWRGSGTELHEYMCVLLHLH